MSLPIQEYINNGSVEHLRDAITGELTRCMMMCGERISSVREQQNIVRVSNKKSFSLFVFLIFRDFLVYLLEPFCISISSSIFVLLNLPQEAPPNQYC